MLNNSFEVDLEQAVEDEARAQVVNFGTDDTAEAVAAFLQKRDPASKDADPPGRGVGLS